MMGKRWRLVVLGWALFTAVAGCESARSPGPPLVISYEPCASQTPTAHGGPASSPLTGMSSCQPVKSSPFLTAGTPGVNGQAAQFLGSVRQDVITSLSPSDIDLRAQMKGVRCDVPIAGNPTLCTPNGPGRPA